MNKRKYKKLQKKYEAKSYYEYRLRKILKYGSTKGDNILVHIIDSRKMDLKHPLKISIYKNQVIVSNPELSSTNIDEFKYTGSLSNPELNKIVDNIKNHLPKLSELTGIPIK